MLSHSPSYPNLALHSQWKHLVPLLAGMAAWGHLTFGGSLVSCACAHVEATTSAAGGSAWRSQPCWVRAAAQPGVGYLGS